MDCFAFVMLSMRAIIFEGSYERISLSAELTKALFLLSEKVERCLVDIHSHVLSFCDQMKLVGQFSDKVTITSVRQHKKQGEVTYRTSSKVIMFY